MSEKFTGLTDEHIAFINKQPMYFVATAAADGRVNLSPKGQDTLRVINKNKVIWLNLTGSGNETAAHLLKNNRMTIMFCSFDKQPLILRLYGQALTIHPRHHHWDAYSKMMPAYTGARQFYDMSIDLVQTSCGYAVPHMTLDKDRVTLDKWADKRGRSGIEEYWLEKNQKSIDGFDTGIVE